MAKPIPKVGSRRNRRIRMIYRVGWRKKPETTSFLFILILRGHKLTRKVLEKATPKIWDQKRLAVTIE